MPRLEVRFSRGPEAKYVAHLDLMRAWERALRRAGIPLAYSQGFSPHTRLATAAPLPVGMTSQAEAMDLWLAEDMSPESFGRLLEPQLPDGLALTEVRPAPDAGPPLAARLRAAGYLVTVRGHDLPGRVERLLSAASLPWREERAGKVREYDLRPLVLGMQVRPAGAEEWHLQMRLAAGPAGTGRPQAVAAALAVEAVAYHRTALVFAEA